MGPLTRLRRIVSQLRGVAIAERRDHALDVLEASNILQDWSIPTTDVLDPSIPLTTLHRRILKRLAAESCGKTFHQEVDPQLIGQILRRAANALLSASSLSTSSLPMHSSSSGQLQSSMTNDTSSSSVSPMDSRNIFVEIVHSCLVILVSWASRLPSTSSSSSDDSSLTKDILCNAAQIATDIVPSKLDYSPMGGHVIAEAVVMWSQACRLQACTHQEGASLHRIIMLLSSRRDVDALLASGPTCWNRVLRALLLDNVPPPGPPLVRFNNLHAQQYHQLVQQAISAVARSSVHLWAWDAVAEVLGQLPGKVVTKPEEAAEAEGDAKQHEEEEEEEDDEEDELMMVEDPRRRQAVYAVAGMMEHGNPTEKAVAAIAAVSLLSGRSNRQLWTKFVSTATTFSRRRSSESWRIGRAGMAKALISLGLSPFCSRSLKAEGGTTRETDWGSCLTALLRLALEELVQECTPLAVCVSQRFLHDSEDAALSVGELFKAADSTSQVEALTVMRSYAEDLATRDPEAYKQGRNTSFTLGAILIVRICWTLSDLNHAALDSTDQAIWVLDILHAVSALAIDSALKIALLRATYNLKSLLETEDEGFENSMNAAREWVMKSLHEEKRRAMTANDASLSVAETKKRARSMSYLLRLAFDLCIDTLRPGPYHFVSELIKLLLDEVRDHTTLPALSSSAEAAAAKESVAEGNGSKEAALVKAQAHRCLRALISKPTLLAYRAGTQHHWDEARRRITANYVKTALESYPSVSTDYQDLAYCLGTVIGAAGSDTTGGALILYCIHMSQQRALALCQKDYKIEQPSTMAILRLLFQTLVVCPQRVIDAALVSVAEEFFLQGLQGNAQGRLIALKIFQEMTSGEGVETMRRTKLAKWYLDVLHRSHVQDLSMKKAVSDAAAAAAVVASASNSSSNIRSNSNSKSATKRTRSTASL